MNEPETPKWCFYIGEPEELVTLYESEDEARGAAEFEIDCADWCEPGDVVEYTVAPMLSALDVLRTQGAERIGEHIAEMIDEWVADDMASEEPPLDLPKALHAKLGQLVVDFFVSNAVSQWWTTDTKRKTAHIYVSGANDDSQEQQP
jgi:hypothetical protein